MSVFQRKGSPFYQYEFQIQKRTFRGSTKRTVERDALAVERDKRREAEESITLELLDPARTTVEQVFERYWKTAGHKLDWAPTLRVHLAELEEFFGSAKPFRDITGADLAAALEGYAAGTQRKNRIGKDGERTLRRGSPSDSTVNRRLAAFRQVWRKARDEWELPVTNIVFAAHVRDEPKERVRHITRDQAKILMAHTQVQTKMMIAWSLVTGCRQNETETLRWSRVNYETMQAEVNTKGGGTRFIELSNAAVAVLAECDRNRPLVFDATNRRKRWEAAVEAAGLDDFTWHDMRHTAATWLGNATGDLAVVMKFLGHSQIATTMKYRHVIRSDVQRAVQTMPELIESQVVQIRKADEL